MKPFPKLRKSFLSYSMLLFLAAITASCEYDVDYRYCIMMTAETPCASFDLDAKNNHHVEVNWGDGEKEQYFIGFSSKQPKHKYSDESAKFISITGHVTGLACSRNQLTSLNVRESKVLGYLDCSRNQLTSLDLSKNTILYQISCQCNELSAEALNALFASLHGNKTNKEKIIDISGNPGANDCDISIAEKKGWIVRNHEIEEF